MVLTIAEGWPYTYTFMGRDVTAACMIQATAACLKDDFAIVHVGTTSRAGKNDWQRGCARVATALDTLSIAYSNSLASWFSMEMLRGNQPDTAPKAPL